MPPDPPPSPAPSPQGAAHVSATRRTLTAKIVNAAASLAIFAVCLYAYTWLGVRKSPPRVKPPKPAGVVVVTQPLIPHEGPVEISANGVVVPLREIRLAAEVSGRVVEQSDNLRAGRMVAAGETLVRIDPVQFELELARLRAQQSQESAELDAAEVNIENTIELTGLAENQVQLAAAESARVEALVRRQAASASEVDVAKRAELAARAGLVELKNRRRELLAARQLIVEKQGSTRVAIERAQLDLDRTILRSPIAGRVIASTTEEQSFLVAGTPFVTIEDTTAAEVRCNLTADQMVWVWNSSAGQSTAIKNRDDDRVPPIPATIQYRSGLRMTQWNARLERIDGAGIDQSTRTYPCLFRIDAPEQFVRTDAAAEALASASETTPTVDSGPSRLMRGMFVSVGLQTRPRQMLYQISESAIRPGNRIWLDENGKLRIASIEIVGRVGDKVVVDAGNLQRSPGVIVSPVSEPRDGMIVVSQDRSVPEGIVTPNAGTRNAG